MKIGLSTGCFFPQTPLESLEKAGQLGAKYVEIFFNTYSELEEEYILKLKAVLEKYNMQAVSVHPFTSAIESFMFFSVYDYKLQDSVAMYEKYFRACNMLGCRYVVFHGCFNHHKYMDMQRYCNNLNLLSRKAREYGVYISQENVYKFKCGYIENIKEFLKYADKDILFTFDIKQAIKSRQSVYRILDLVADRISHIHLSDCTGRQHSLMPFEGSFDFDRFFAYIKQNSKAEYSIVELYSHTIKNEQHLAQALHKLQKYSE